MTDIYSPGVFNTQHNSNTTIQGSTLQSTKGPLNTMFNLQGLRTVKGRISLVDNQNILTCYTVTNLYDLSPIKLNCGDIILSLAVANGSNEFNFVESLGSDNPQQNWPHPLLYSNIQFYLGTAPTYIPGLLYPTPGKSSGALISQQWIPNPQVLNSANTLTNTFSTSVLGDIYSPPTPHTIPILINNCIGSINNGGNSCYTGVYQWLNCLVYSGQSGIDPSINVTLLVLNQNNSQ
jgi:hypothetical protein